MTLVRRQAEQRPEPDADEAAGSAAANQTQPCSEPDATPPTKAPMLQPKPSRAPQPISSPPSAAASSDSAAATGCARTARGRGRGHRAEDHAEVGQARGVAQDRIGRARACGPAIARIRRWEKSAPSSVAILAPQTVKPKVTLQGWLPAANTAIDRSPMQDARRTRSSATARSSRRAACAMATPIRRRGSARLSQRGGEAAPGAEIVRRRGSDRCRRARGMPADAGCRSRCRR